MKNVTLKVNIKSLAAESRIIRIEEQKALDNARFCSGYYTKKVLDSIDAMELNEVITEDSKSKFKEEFLANYQGNNEKAEYAPSHYARYTQLHNHRVTVVREEARVALLAYGFLNGKTYKQVENSPNSTVPEYILSRVAKKVNRAICDDTGEFVQKYSDILAWYNVKPEVPAELAEVS